jgi:TetR/AcrR family transcriptional repressor of nem operon
MRITKEKAEENRISLISAAGRLFREKGIDGVGVAEISKEAGLTHGALYAHFPSKDALAAAAMAEGVERSYKRLHRHDRADGTPDLSEFLDYYLSAEARDNLGGSCALAASASEVARQDSAVSAHFTEGYLNMANALERQLAGQGVAQDASRSKALAITAAMLGGLTVARATAKSNPDLSDEVLAAMRQVLGELGGGL